ncbi:MAG: GIY-YIG nuclease family protein [Acidobacteriaceae bacterium]
MEEVMTNQGFVPPIQCGECKVHWVQLCSNQEIREWFENKKMPRSLHGKLTRPGVYRFIFPLDNIYTPKFRCYVGETKCFRDRIRDHLTLEEMEMPEEVGVEEIILSDDKYDRKLSPREKAVFKLFQKKQGVCCFANHSKIGSRPSEIRGVDH